MATQFELGGISVDLVRKDIKHVHLSVYPPTGRVRIAAPRHMNVDTIRVFAIAKLGWIRAQQRKLRAQEREAPREYIERESHYLWGRRLLMKLVEREAGPSVGVSHNKLVLQVRPGTDAARRAQVLDGWYRTQLREAAAALIAKWQPLLGVQVSRCFVQQMKTKWGSCTPGSHSIRLNTELAKKPPELLEYVVVHEMAHLLEPNHGRKFLATMDLLVPHWPQHRDALNRLPLRQTPTE